MKDVELFKRRKKKHAVAAIREYFWPSAGWGRAFSYFRHRLARIPGTPYAIAAGFASGAAVSFTPFLGFHFLLAALLAWLIGANILTSAMGTAVGNPWTFPLILPATYYLGCWLLGMPGTEDFLGQINDTLGRYSLMDILSSPLATLGPFLQSTILPMFVGGLLMGSVVWIITYWLIEKLVREYKHKRFARRANAARKRREKRTGDVAHD
ncbi:MAG: DUF2062 domain-containing protein [Alphaproteobacteria bacterium]|nr:DUF2062 domain-containing protein [Alphaproteobacteria bacterium]